MKDNNKIIVIGNGGHARSCMDILNSITTYSISMNGRIDIGWIIEDTRTLTDEKWNWYCELDAPFLLAIGQIHDATPRIRAVNEVLDRFGSFMTLISPNAIVSPLSCIGTGTVIGHGACVNINTFVGMYCILNTHCVLEHDTRIGAFCHISTGAVVNGGSKIGHGVFVGSNAVILQDLTICDEVTIGAGSVVIRDITEKGIYVGNPATKIR